MFARWVTRILLGDWSGAAVEPPRLDLGDYEQIVRRMRRAADLEERFPDPRMLAVAIGLRVRSAPVRCAGGEITDGQLILYQPDADSRMQGLRVHHALAHALLARERWDANETDAWLLTAELAAPARATREAGLQETVEAQAHAPEWLIAAWCSAVASVDCAETAWDAA